MPCTKVVLGVTAVSLCRPAILLPSFLFGWYGCFLLATTTAVSNHHWENRQPRPTVNRRSQRWAAASFRQQHQQLIQQTLSISAIYLCLYRPAFSFIFFPSLSLLLSLFPLPLIFCSPFSSKLLLTASHAHSHTHNQTGANSFDELCFLLSLVAAQILSYLALLLLPECGFHNSFAFQGRSVHSFIRNWGLQKRKNLFIFFLCRLPQLRKITILMCHL